MSKIISTNIGLTGGLASASVDKSVDMATLNNGMYEFQHPRELTVSVSKERTEASYYGIYENEHALNALSFGTGGVVFESVTHTRTERVSDRQMGTDPDYAAADGTFVPPTGEKFIQFTQNMIWLGFQETIDMTVRYRSDYDSAVKAYLRPGARLTNSFAICPALYPDTVTDVESVVALMDLGKPFIAFSTTAPEFYEHLVVSSCNFAQSSSDWHSAQLSLSRFIPNTPDTANTSPLFSKLILWKDGTEFATLGGEYMFDDEATNEFPDFYQITITTNLTATGTPTRTESIEFYPSDPEQTAYMETGYTHS